jgi:hypothetical protein
MKPNTKINLKIFLLNKSYWEFKDKNSQDIIEVIKDNHIKKLHSKFDSLEGVDEYLAYSKEDDFELWSYCYNQPKENFYWKLFLPDELVEKQNFKITEFSFVLFIKYKSAIYCLIGGSGMSVIKKYIDTSFGIDMYQHFANPTEDVLIELHTRGIASNISQKKHIYNLNQTLSETLEYSEIPTKIKLEVRDELKKTIFKKYSLDKNKAILEVGSYFSIRKKLDYSELKELIIDIDQIKNDKNFHQLTLFKKIREDDLLNNLDEYLKDLIVDDVLLNVTPDRVKYLQNDIIEIVHPSSLESFYECSRFEIKFKYARKDIIEVTDRSQLYTASLKHVFDKTEDITKKFEIKKKLYLLNIIGYRDETDKIATYANLFSHVIAEIEYLGKKYFRIDTDWYFLDDKFIQLMNNDALEYYSKYKLKEDLLNKWPDGKDEDFYNLTHTEKNYYVLDKRITENIEICDILILKDDKIYFVHVKNGFNTKMRELYIQVVLSAKRLSNDIKNNDGSQYLRKTLKYYNKKSKTKKIDVKDVVSRIKSKELEVIFVMAFKNNYYKGKTVKEKIDASKSNIAKYSIIQTIKEMQPYFPVKLIDISEL